MSAENPATAGVLRKYGMEGAATEVIRAGLINKTWLVRHRGAKYILQRVNPMFSPVVHEDIAAVTNHLRDKGMQTPVLLTSGAGELAVRIQGDMWRLYTWLDGETYNTADNPGIAREAGRVLGNFHKALLDLDHRFRNPRRGVHDTAVHLANLAAALRHQSNHPRYRDISPLGREIMSYAEMLPILPALPRRNVHGDPKINNCLFQHGDTRALCMIDFDTQGTMSLPLELGEAMRSWCNPSGENTGEASFSVENFRSALEGYVQEFGEYITPRESQAIVPATRTIYIELAARFCADALNENFFDWDPRQFDSHSKHSHVRAMSQLSAYKSLQTQTPILKAAIDDIFVR